MRSDHGHRFWKWHRKLYRASSVPGKFSVTYLNLSPFCGRLMMHFFHCLLSWTNFLDCTHRISFFVLSFSLYLTRFSFVSLLCYFFVFWPPTLSLFVSFPGSYTRSLAISTGYTPSFFPNTSFLICTSLFSPSIFLKNLIFAAFNCRDYFRVGRLSFYKKNVDFVLLKICQLIPLFHLFIHFFIESSIAFDHGSLALAPFILPLN